MYYLAKEGIVRLKSYTQKLFWIVFFVVIIFVDLYFGVGSIISGAVLGAILGAIISALLDVLIANPNVNRWDRLSYNQLKSENGAEITSWSSITKAVYKMPDVLELYINGNRRNLRVVSDQASTKDFLEQKLGKKLEVR
jgi:hypothetical protein